jgi:hypothetical protein
MIAESAGHSNMERDMFVRVEQPQQPLRQRNISGRKSVARNANRAIESARLLLRRAHIIFFGSPNFDEMTGCGSDKHSKRH